MDELQTMMAGNSGQRGWALRDEITLELIENSDDFWALYDELLNDESGFIFNRTMILDAFKDKELYGLRVNEINYTSKQHSIYCANSDDLLPCLCVKHNNTAMVLWTHTRARRRGFAKELVKLLNVQHAYNPLPGSENFWRSCNIQMVNRDSVFYV